MIDVLNPYLQAMSEKLILVTNDDGITSGGIKALIDVARDYGRVVVVAPNSPQSGQGHAVTLTKPLHIVKQDLYEGIEAYACSGTPVDCVKWGVHKALSGQLPDFCLSGINHGSNNSINVLYSGTMSAAMEGAIQGIPSIGFSYLDFNEEADMSDPAKVVRDVMEKVVSQGMPSSRLLNVNIPVLPYGELKGLRIARQADAKWVEEFEEGKDDLGRREFKISGKFINFDKGEDCDVWALKNGYVSVVPVQYDLTSHKDLDSLQTKWNQDG